MKPDREGIWEWFEKDGTKRLVHVCDVVTPLRQITGHAEPCWRVYWWGGYYRIEDEITDLYDCNNKLVEKNYLEPAEWDDRWGKFVGEQGCVPEEQLYLMPTPEEAERIRKEYENRTERN